jgi:diacylglycerol kinase (ATP)
MLSGRGTDERLPKGFTPPKRQTWSPAFSSTNPASVRIIYRVRTCVIFNPAARGEKARHFRRHLDKIASRGALKVTAIPGDARRLAGEAVAEGFELIVAAGGDGTVNEVLNGIGDTRDGFARARLGVLPLGTINVFAREIGLPLRIEQAWETLLRGRETRLDLPCAEFSAKGVRQRQYFVQLAGAGLDARAIELVTWPLKKKIGPLAYVMAGVKALRDRLPRITARVDGQSATGELILVGNGRFYGGPLEIFPQADLHDGFLDICVLPRANWLTLLRCLPGLLARRKLPAHLVLRYRATVFELVGDAAASFELDGEWAGNLPVTLSVEREQLRVAVP